MALRLCVADAPLVLALRARPERRAGARPEAPVAREGEEARVEPHLPRRRVVVRHQGLGVVHQHLGGDPAEVPERPLDAVQPGRLALVAEGAHEQPPRVAERGDEQEHPSGLALDGHPQLAEVHLQLVPGRRLEPHRRPRRGRQLPPQRRHRALDRPQADAQAMLPLEVLPHHVGVALVAPEPLREPALQPIQRRGALRRPVGRPAARREVAPHRHVAAAQLRRDPPHAPAQRLQPDHRRHLVRLPHPVPLVTRQGARVQHHPLHRDLPRSGGGPVPHGVRGPAFHVARQ